MRRLGRITAAILLLAGASAVAALLSEAAVLLVLGEQVRFPRRVVGASFGVRINEPGAVYRHRSPDVDVAFRINREGMRADRDYPYFKEPGTLRIVSLGDSFTIGYEVEVEQTFSSVLERELRARGYPVEVLNAGVSGYSTAEACLYLERELVRYEPDLILISFVENDLQDNVRTGLFRLEGEELLETAQSYVPGGRLANFLNTSPVFNLLSERSNAFALAKEQLTLLAKRSMPAGKEPGTGEASAALLDSQRRLAAALFERIYRDARARELPLVIQSIPTPIPPQAPTQLRDSFPLEHFDVGRDGILFFPASNVLRPLLGRELLYHQRSHVHWTPESHRLAGQALANRIVAAGLLRAR